MIKTVRRIAVFGALSASSRAHNESTGTRVTPNPANQRSLIAFFTPENSTDLLVDLAPNG